MTDSAAGARPRRRRRGLVALVVLTVLLLTPPWALLMFYLVYDGLAQPSPAGWTSDPEATGSLLIAAAVVLGLPTGGAATGWAVAGRLRRDRHLAAAAGTLTGTLLLWAAAVVYLCFALRSASWWF
ncbi:hypothetical protein ACIQUQ_19990 [Streptomyces sp. NPDC101118]|uniref:hypothetical protein n=1 Tax=Streptomyces sp. NPDC101118 TaxID=3366109 RepID=UPI00380C98B2